MKASILSMSLLLVSVAAGAQLASVTPGSPTRLTATVLRPCALSVLPHFVVPHVKVSYDLSKLDENVDWPRFTLSKFLSEDAANDLDTIENGNGGFNFSKAKLRPKPLCSGDWCACGDAWYWCWLDCQGLGEGEYGDCVDACRRQQIC